MTSNHSHAALQTSGVTGQPGQTTLAPAKARLSGLLKKRIEAAAAIIGDADPQFINWTMLAKATGLTREIVQREFRPGYRDRRNASVKRGRKAGLIETKIRHTADASVRQSEIAARISEIPEDTRTPAQRLMGDPLPGRSALSRISAASSISSRSGALDRTAGPGSPSVSVRPSVPYQEGGR